MYVGTKIDELLALDLYHVFQPIVNLETKEAFGYEMLLRSDEMGTPDRIFKWAEEEDRLFDLDMRSIEIAFHTINQRVSCMEGLHVFINILPSTVGNPSSLADLIRLKSSLNTNVNCVVFEITEHKKDNALMRSKSVVGDMKKQGFLIAVDDLGKGESNLPYVIELEPHIVKLDRYFSIDLARNRKKQRALEFITKFAGADTLVILEGLETMEDVAVAESLGIKYGQGYVLGRPEPPEYYL